MIGRHLMRTLTPVLVAAGVLASAARAEAALRLELVARGMESAVAFVADPGGAGHRCSSSCRTAWSASSRAAWCRRRPLLDLREVISRGGRARAPGPGLSARRGRLAAGVRELHRPIGPHGDRALHAPARQPAGGRARVAIRSPVARRAPLHPAALFESQRRPPRLRPRRLPVHRTRRRRIGQRPAESRAVDDDAARQDAPHRRERAARRFPRLRRARRTTRSSGGRACSRRSGRSGIGTRGVTASTMSAPMPPERSSSATWARARARRSTTSPPAPADGTTDGDSARARSPRPGVAVEPVEFGPFVEPLFDYGRGRGLAVTGGYVYRGTALPARYRGRYFFGDYGSGRVWSLGLAVECRDVERRRSSTRSSTPTNWAERSLDCRRSRATCPARSTS